MTTLDDKFLNGPNVGYCSDSDDDIEPKNDSEFQCSNDLTFNIQQKNSINTGPKGVLADYLQHLKNCEIEQKKKELKILKDSKQLTLELSVNEDKLDDELFQIRKKRLKQIRNAFQIFITEINDSNEFLSIIENSKDTLIFIYIYREGLDIFQAIDVLLELVRKCKKKIKLCKVKASILGTSENFTANALPTLQIYLNNKLIGNFIRLNDEIGEDFSCTQLIKFLENNEIDLE